MQRTTIIFMFMDPTHTHGVAPKDATAGPGRQRVCLAIASRRQAGAEIHMMGACVRACRTVRPERASCVFVCVSREFGNIFAAVSPLSLWSHIRSLVARR